MSNYQDIANMEELRQSAKSIQESAYQTFRDAKNFDARNVAGDIVTGIGNELMGHASITTLKHLGRAKSALTQATKDLADRATQAMSDARDGVRATLRDATAPLEQFGEDRTSNPFGGARVTQLADGSARLEASVDEQEQEPARAPGQPEDEEVEGEDIVFGRPAPEPAPGQGPTTAAPQNTEPAQADVPDTAPARAATTEEEGGNLLERGLGVAGKDVGKDIGEDVAEQTVKKGLKGAFIASIGEDESGVGLLATAGLGIATLLAGAFIHKHTEPPTAVNHYKQVAPINYSYQQGI